MSPRVNSFWLAGIILCVSVAYSSPLGVSNQNGTPLPGHGKTGKKFLRRWNFQAEAINKLQARMRVLPKAAKPPKSFEDWADLKLATCVICAFKGDYEPIAPKSSNQTLNFNGSEGLAFLVRPKIMVRLPGGAFVSPASSMEVQLRLRDPHGNLLAKSSRRAKSSSYRYDRSDFKIYVSQPGKYTLEADILDDVGNAIELKNGPPKTTLTVNQTKPKAIEAVYGPWSHSSRPNLWQREIFVRAQGGSGPGSPVHFPVDLRIVPLAGYPTDSKLTWLDGKSALLTPSYGGQPSWAATGVNQYYDAAPERFPANGSRQMDVYTVKVQYSKQEHLPYIGGIY